MKIISLLTDFGLQDGYAGVLKGVIWNIAPDAQIADITHQISPQNVKEGAILLERTAHYFPAGTVHLAVVDPGVGTTRRPIAAQLGEYFFVGPDNGLMTPLLERAEQAGQPVQVVHLNRPEYWLPRLSNVFHGRDLFAPVAAHLANGVPVATLGSPVNDPVRLRWTQPERTPAGWHGEITQIDVFGNLSTNLKEEHLQPGTQLIVQLGSTRIQGLCRTFGDRAPGEWAAMIDSSDYLSLGIVNGSAARVSGARVGDPVEISFAQSR